MSDIAFTPEEISVIDKKIGFVVFDWAKHLINHILTQARSSGVSIVYMNTVDTLDSGDTQEMKVDYFYERLPPIMGFKKEQANLRGKGKETLWAYHLDVVEASSKKMIKLCQSITLDSIPKKYQGAFIGILGRKPSYTSEEIKKVLAILDKKSGQKSKSMNKYYYDWKSREWSGSQRFHNKVNETVVLQKIPSDVQSFIAEDPVLLKFWSLMLSQSQHFGNDVIGFALVSKLNNNIWVINEIQTDCLNRYQKLRGELWKGKKEDVGMTFETLRDMLVANNRSNWVDRVESNEGLKQALLANPNMMNDLPDDSKDIDAWIKENKEGEAGTRRINDLLRHFASQDLTKKIFRI